MANCSLSRADALPGSVWRVRWAEGGVCPAVSERYNRGGTAERLHGWQAACYGNGSNRGIDGEKPRSTPQVVPGAAPAMAYIIYIYIFILYIYLYIIYIYLYYVYIYIYYIFIYSI